MMSAASAFLSPGAAVLARPAPARGRSPATRGRATSLVTRAAMVRVEFTPADGGEDRLEVTAARVLRDVAVGEKVELYQGMNKLLNCGGIGNCGTCILAVDEGAPAVREDGRGGEEAQGQARELEAGVPVPRGGDEAPEGAVLKVSKPKK